jgi:tetratricopeptide (TPR) repeat protein
MRSRSRAKSGSCGVLLVAAATLASGVLAPSRASAQDDALDSAYRAAEVGAWEPAARAWRRALERAPTLAGAAAYTLRGANADSRPAIRRIFLAPPFGLGSRRALAQLETDWGSAREGWAALATLPPSDSTVAAWAQFADEAEASGAPLVARDAFAAALAARPSAGLAARAAAAALAGGDAGGALALSSQSAATRGLDSSAVARIVLPVRVRALARLGRAGDAATLIERYGHFVDSAAHAAFAREVAWGYVRVGDVDRAAATIAHFGLGDDREIAGWLALYTGDLKSARGALREAGASSPDVVTAMALLSRTSADTAAVVGRAFTLLARGDSANAADAFAAAGASAALRDAAPLLLATAARLHTARHDDGRAIPLWRAVVERYTAAPEAPEADLEWGRALKRRSDTPGAVERWQHLILTYPDSALVPQARHELELAKAAA